MPFWYNRSYMPTTLPGMPSREAGWVLQQMDRKLKEFPEVERVFGKLGRADTATDPAPMTMIESTVLLRPQTEWRPGYTKERLVADWVVLTYSAIARTSMIARSSDASLSDTFKDTIVASVAAD